MRPVAQTVIGSVIGRQTSIRHCGPTLAGKRCDQGGLFGSSNHNKRTIFDRTGSRGVALVARRSGQSASQKPACPSYYREEHLCRKRRSFHGIESSDIGRTRRTSCSVVRSCRRRTTRTPIAAGFNDADEAREYAAALYDEMMESNVEGFYAFIHGCDGVGGQS